MVVVVCGYNHKPKKHKKRKKKRTKKKLTFMFCCTVSKNGSESFNDSRITRELRYTSTMCSSSVNVSSFTISWKFILFAAFICNAVNCAHKARRKKICSETFKSNMYDNDHIP
jgi:hypothetical protein